MAITNASRLADFGSGIGTYGAVIQVDNTNKRVGIGTTNPQATLQVGTAVSVYGTTGIVSATSFYGDGANITGLGNTDFINATQLNVIGVTTVGAAVTINSTGIDAVSGVVTASSFVGNVTGNASGTAGGLTGTPDIAVRNITGVAATFTGVLTYEDVTNVDSVGIVTARGGLEVGAAGVGATISSGGNVIISGITTFNDNISIPSDSKKLFAGTDSEMQVFHDGTDSLIKDTRNSGTVKIQADNFRVIDKDSSQTMLSAEVDDAVDLYFNGSKKFETHNTGIRVTGIATVTSTIYVNTNGSSIAENNLNFASSGKAYIDHRTTSQDIDFRVSHGSALDRTAITVGSAGITTFYDTPHDDIGSLRSIPLQDESSTANYVLVASDAGQCVHAHSSTTQVTVNPSVFSAGDAVSIVNGSSGNITLTQGTSMTIRNTADSSTGSKTLASFGMCTLWFSGHNVAYLSGAGLS